MLKNKKGITLITLIITIIVLLILAGVSIATLTESGVFEKARQAEEKQENAQIKEEITLSEYENEIAEYISGSRDISLEEIKEIVKKEVEEQISSTSTGPNSLTGALASLSYGSDSATVSAGTRTLINFSSNLSIATQDYIEYNSTTGNIEVLKSGWYVINIDGNADYSGEGNFSGNLVINGKSIYLGSMYIANNTYRGQIGKCTTIYLKEGDTINFNIYNQSALIYYTVRMAIYAN